MKSDKNIVGWVASGVAGVFTTLQENPVIQIISFCLTILSVLVSLVYTLWKWYRKAKADKKESQKQEEEQVTAPAPTIDLDKLIEAVVADGVITDKRNVRDIAK